MAGLRGVQRVQGDGARVEQLQGIARASRPARRGGADWGVRGVGARGQDPARVRGSRHDLGVDIDRGTELVRALVQVHVALVQEVQGDGPRVARKQRVAAPAGAAGGRGADRGVGGVGGRRKDPGGVRDGRHVDR